MIVMKFGGTSLGDADRVKTAGEIIQKYAAKNPLVVVSAHGHVTDRLDELTRAALAGNFDTAAIRDAHAQILDGLDLAPDLVDALVGELCELVRGIALVKELTPRTYDYVVSFGERCSSRIVAAHLCSLGLDAEAADAYDIGMITDSHFGGARPLLESEKAIRKAVAKSGKLLVVTGYIGKNEDGEITTLGRGGSDFTATYIGAAIGAEEVQIWTDVDGIMTANPALVPTARPIEEVSFEEASELAYYGAQVIHPSTMIPAIKKDIPVRVLNTYRLDYPGTRIMRQINNGQDPVKAIVYKKNITLIHIVSTRMLLHHGFMASLFEIFNRHRIVIDMISTSEVTVSLTTDTRTHLPEALDEIAQFAAATSYENKTIVCVVGQGMERATGTPYRIFSALKAMEIDVQMISQGASKINFAFLVDDVDCERAVQALHTEFFERT